MAQSGNGRRATESMYGLEYNTREARRAPVRVVGCNAVCRGWARRQYLRRSRRGCGAARGVMGRWWGVWRVTR